jgi:hypothetical protein
MKLLGERQAALPTTLSSSRRVPLPNRCLPHERQQGVSKAWLAGPGLPAYPTHSTGSQAHPLKIFRIDERVRVGVCRVVRVCVCESVCVSVCGSYVEKAHAHARSQAGAHSSEWLLLLCEGQTTHAGHSSAPHVTPTRALFENQLQVRVHDHSRPLHLHLPRRTVGGPDSTRNELKL